MAKCILFVEGSSNSQNGDLRTGFRKLLEQADRPMPQIVMCNDTANAMRLFRLEVARATPRFERVLLLADLDGPEETRPIWLTQHGLLLHQEQVFCMVQEMEAWFLSQPAMLHDFYRPPLPHTLPKAAPARVLHPAQELARCTKDHRPKGTYHKTAHGARLLAELRLPPLEADFSDVARLVAAL